MSALEASAGIDATAEGDIEVKLTMTTPACPLGEQIIEDAEHRLHALPGVRSARVEIRLASSRATGHGPLLVLGVFGTLIRRAMRLLRGRRSPRKWASRGR